MLEQRGSETAMFMAAYRARASKQPKALIDDPWANDLAGETGHALARRYDEVYPHMELWTALRVAYIDARVRRAVAAPRSIAQVVLLGAGLDTRAARLASQGVRFFEVDHPDSQADKLERITKLDGYPRDAATYVTCDFERDDFIERLVASGFAADRRTLFVWEGVTPYLTEAAVRGTLKRLASGAHPESVVVFDHLRKKIVAGDVKDARDKESRDFVGELGEPLRWGCDDILPVLYEDGFRRVRATTFDEICLDLTGTYDRARKFRFQSIAVASPAAPDLP